MSIKYNRPELTRNQIKNIVLTHLKIGEQYRIDSDHSAHTRTNGYVEATLLSISNNHAVFQLANDVVESFTYQDILQQLQNNNFKAI